MTKLLRLIFLILISAFFPFCTKDKSNNKALIGTWKATFLSNKVISIASLSGAVVASHNNTGEASDIDYTLVLTGSEYTTSGNYAYNSSTITNTGQEDVTVFDEQQFEGVSDNGTYSTSSNIITISGNLVPNLPIEESVSEIQGDNPTDFTYEINGDILTLYQNQEVTKTTQSITNTIYIETVSRWKRQ